MGLGKELSKGSGIVAGVGFDNEQDKEEELDRIVEVEREFDNEVVVVVDEDTGI